MGAKYKWMGHNQAALLSVLDSTPRTVRELLAELDGHHSLNFTRRKLVPLLDGLQVRGLADLCDVDGQPCYCLSSKSEALQAQAHAYATVQASKTTQGNFRPISSTTEKRRAVHGTVVEVRSEA